MAGQTKDAETQQRPGYQAYRHQHLGKGIQARTQQCHGYRDEGSHIVGIRFAQGDQMIAVEQDRAVLVAQPIQPALIEGATTAHEFPAGVADDAHRKILAILKAVEQHLRIHGHGKVCFLQHQELIAITQAEVDRRADPAVQQTGPHRRTEWNAAGRQTHGRANQPVAIDAANHFNRAELEFKAPHALDVRIRARAKPIDLGQAAIRGDRLIANIIGATQDFLGHGHGQANFGIHALPMGKVKCRQHGHGDTQQACDQHQCCRYLLSHAQRRSPYPRRESGDSARDDAPIARSTHPLTQQSAGRRAISARDAA